VALSSLSNQSNLSNLFQQNLLDCLAPSPLQVTSVTVSQKHDCAKLGAGAHLPAKESHVTHRTRHHTDFVPMGCAHVFCNQEFGKK
jgi:hypothetical protein